MNALMDAAKELSDFMHSKGWKHCIIGGLAVQYWGEPRNTLDADFTLLSGWGDDQAFIDPLLSAFASRISDARDFALANRILLLYASNGRSVDLALGATMFEEEMIERSKPTEIAEGYVLPCCSAEDLFVSKAFASRPQDWRDAETICARNRLDKAYIIHHLDILSGLKEEPEILDRARQLLSKYQ